MSATANHVRVEDAGGVRAIVLDRAAKANALCAAMLDDIRHAIERAPRDGMDLLVLRSAAPTLFCAGGDIEEFALGEQALERQGAALRELMAAMARCPLPLLAVARGKAAGAGVILLAMTDLVIAAQDLSLACPEMAFSMYPVIVQAALETKISAARARQLCLSGQALDAAAARDLGLVTDVLGLDGFETLAERRLAYYAGRRAALAIARKARLAMEPPDATVARVRALEPLMHENFRIPGVRETIQHYLAGLRARRAG
ncbi:enoyl-CoA hydratase/isomerase family protein [Bordetella bronchiseptica]|uniref:enoyl-CoA hydratase/isomerase family protein n=1 Tax=Bordetella bronchiseptica TaxID=518 RepID=UPI000461A15E|nr:enoyl-CoA hydratase/isomerase family protein [Bordetella bronchiseptica]KDD13721.1 enoyl-CoA hydratase/isomerase family protein [Bordetella bronchiseptica MBORD731]